MVPNYMKRLLIVAVLSFLAIGYASAQDDGSAARTLHRVQKSYNIFFEINRSEVDASYQSNARALKQLKADCQATVLYGKTIPDTIYIHATASPDGPMAFNLRLAQQRANSTKQALLEIAPDFAGSKFVIEYQVEDWGGLRQVLLADQAFPQREQMLQILSEVTSQDNVHMVLRDCTEGWEYFVNNYLHALRNSSIGMVIITDAPLDEFSREGSYPLHPFSYPSSGITLSETMPALEYAPESQMQWKKMIMAARTNLLLPGMSVGVEFPIKDNWSIGIDYMYPWILPKNNKWCLETIGGFVEARYWFPGKKYKWNRVERLQGHSIGLYGGVGYYDYQQQADGLQGEYIDVGVDYTFALPVAKGKLRMEFNIGFGFVRSWYRPYYMSSDYEDLIKEPGILYNTTNFFGPTRAGVSLVVPIVVKTKAPRNLR